ncbi:MAG: amidohydrolase family protein [Desulfobacterales bacterium]
MKSSDSETIIFENALLIDGCGGEPIPCAFVAVSDGLIREVSDRPIKGSGRRLALGGKILMPGLIDAHVHPGLVELTMAGQLSLSPAVYVHRVSRNLETDLQLGYTTLRDASLLDIGFKLAIEEGYINGPRLLLAVTGLIQSGAEGLDPGFLRRPIDFQNPLGMRPEVCDGPDEVRRAARRVLGMGADQVKIFASGEVASQSQYDRTTPYHCKFSVPELRAAAEAAAEAGTYVMAHAYGPRAVANCLEAGVACIEHGNLLDDETARLMAEAGTYYVPTLTTYSILANESRAAMPARSLEKLTMVQDQGMRAVEAALRAGVRIGSGSDIIGPFQELKGRELALKAEIIGPMAAIVAATKTNAELMGLYDRLGTIEAGKTADLIVIDQNPLENMAVFENALQHVVLVMKQGRIYKQTSMDGIK